MTRTVARTARLAGLLGGLALLAAACGGLGWGSEAPTVDGVPIDDPLEIMALETTYLEVLQRVDRVDRVERGGELVLTGPDVELRYRAGG